MTKKEKYKVQELREQGISYGKISSLLSLPENTVKSYCRRHKFKIDRPKENTCPVCGAELIHIPGHKKKRFCSDACRMRWWNTHKEFVDMKAIYEFTCAYCHKPFKAYGHKERKYCSHQCYVADRFGV